MQPGLHSLLFLTHLLQDEAFHCILRRCSDAKQFEKKIVLFYFGRTEQRGKRYCSVCSNWKKEKTIFLIDALNPCVDR